MEMPENKKLLLKKILPLSLAVLIFFAVWLIFSLKTAVSILIALLLFGVMIFLHEFGHYFVARLCKVKVLEFAVGMGPQVFTHTSKKSGIAYSLRALPIGGFTSMQGEDGEDEDPHALVNRPRWQRFLVLAAGSFMNLLSGVIAMFIYLSITAQVGTNVVAQWRDNPVSQQYGLEIGDEIVAVNGTRMTDFTYIANVIALDGKDPVDLTVVRDGKEIVLENVQFPTEEVEGTTVAAIDFYFQGIRPSFPTLLKQSVTQSFSTIRLVYKTLAELITGKFGINAVSGPVGTVSVIASVATQGFTTVLYLFVIISINLGVMNLLPLPALDGGRLVFLLIEAVTRKKVSPKVETYVHLAGMILLLGFMAVITVFDVLKLFR